MTLDTSKQTIAYSRKVLDIQISEITYFRYQGTPRSAL